MGNKFDESFMFDTSDILGIARSLADKAVKRNLQIHMNL